MAVNQYSQSEAMNSSEALEDSVASKSNDTLDETQLTNIGIGLLGFSPISATSGKLNTNIGFNRIGQSLSIILRTAFKEVPMLPILGSNLDKFLFDPLDEVWDEVVKHEIEETILKLEPRITVVETNIFHEADQNKAIVEITYRLTNTNIVKVFRDTIVTSNGGDVI